MKRVEKSPKAKQYYPTTLVLSALLSPRLRFPSVLVFPFLQGSSIIYTQRSILPPKIFSHILASPFQTPTTLLFYYTCFILVRSNDFSSSLHLIYPCSLQWIAPFPLLTHTTHNPPLSTASPPSFFISFLLSIVVIICYIWKFLLLLILFYHNF